MHMNSYKISNKIVNLWLQHLHFFAFSPFLHIYFSSMKKYGENIKTYGFKSIKKAGCLLNNSVHGIIQFNPQKITDI